MNCPSCQADVDEGDAFCRSCGAGQPEPVAADHGERRQLTAVFYDLVGSTDLSTRVDAEDLQVAVASYHDMCMGVVRNFGGTPANTMGDGGLVYFGFPTAHEDDPLRAVMAGWEILDELAELNAGLRRDLPGFDHELEMRIGVHTGTVVLGAAGSDQGTGRLAVGEALNQAARIEALAPANGIAVSDVTARRVQGVVDLASLGHHELKGITKPVEIFRVERIRPGQARFISTQTTSPLVGRDDELTALVEAWREASGGAARAVLLSGEAGLGKSRLHQQLRGQLSGTLHAWFELAGSELMSRTAFHPIIQAVRQVLEFDDLPADQHLDRLRHWLNRVGIDDDERSELLAEFLGLRPANPAGSAEERRNGMIEALCDWWLGVARLVPTVLVAEDLHWFDPSTLAVLEQLWSRADDDALLLIGTSRRANELGFTGDWWRVELLPLSLDECTRLVDHLGGELTETERAALAARADGVPLFAEELVNAAEHGSPHGDGTVPESLRDLMTARLDRLGPAKGVLQLASLIGREFSLTTLRDLADAGTRLEDTLAQLADERFIARRGVGEKARYLFRHALLQDAARESMLRRQREAEHRRIAEYLQSVEGLSGRDDVRPEVVGHHFEQAGDVVTAIEQYSLAGALARARAAVHEAAAHYERSVVLIRELEPSVDRDEQELELQLLLGSALALGESFSSPAARAAYARAVELSEGCEERAAEYGTALNGVLQHHVSAATFDAALDAGERLREFAEKRGDRDSELVARRALCQVHFWPGRFAEVWNNAARAYELYEPGAPADERYLLGIETGVLALVYGAWGAWALGRPEESRDLADRAMALAHGQDDVYQVCYAAAYLSVHAIMLNEPERCAELADVAHGIAVEHEYLPLAGLSKYAAGWAQAQLGDPAGVDRAMAGVNELAGIGVGVGGPGCMAVLAELCAHAGRLEEGFAYAALGEAMADDSGQHFYTVEIHRSSALLHLAAASAADAAAEVEAALVAAEEAARAGLELAREQGSPSLGLRAAEVLRNVRARRGDEDADRLLADAVARFPEGSAGADLDRVRAALA